MEAQGTAGLPDWLEDAAAPQSGECDMAERIRILEAKNAELHVVHDTLSSINDMMATQSASDIYERVIRGIAASTLCSRVGLAAVEEDALRMIAEVVRAQGLMYRETVTASRMPDRLVPLVAGRVPHVAIQAGTDRGFETAVAMPIEIGACVVPIIVDGVAVALAIACDPPHGHFTEFQLYLALTWTARAGDALGRIALQAQLQAKLDESRALATTDLLTGLPNRRGLTVALEKEIALASRHGDTFAFLIFDLDGFKQINDTQGHDAGDAALRIFADTLAAAKRTVDVAARFAGDEFVVMLHAVDRGQTEMALERFYEMIHAAGLRSSCGAALYPAHGATTEQLYHAADAALYASKRAGKDRFTFAG